MDDLTKILYHFIAHQDEYVELYGGKYVVIRADFKTAGVFESKAEACRCSESILDTVSAIYPAIPGEKAYTVSLRIP